MKCPDCGNRLTEVFIDTEGGAYRCFKCGGFFIDSWTATRLKMTTMAAWRRIAVDPVWFSGGKGVCPMDGTMMQKYLGENMAGNLEVKRCIRCGKWWFPGSSLFIYKEAMAVSKTLTRQSSPGSNFGKLVLPLACAALLVTGMLVGKNIVEFGSTNNVFAVENIQGFTATYHPPGDVIIGFKTDVQIDKIQYRKTGDSVWLPAAAVWQNGVYVVRVSGITAGNEYEIIIGGQVFKFRT